MLKIRTSNTVNLKNEDNTSYSIHRFHINVHRRISRRTRMRCGRSYAACLRSNAAYLIKPSTEEYNKPTPEMRRLADNSREHIACAHRLGATVNRKHISAPWLPRVPFFYNPATPRSYNMNHNCYLYSFIIYVFTYISILAFTISGCKKHY